MGFGYSFSLFLFQVARDLRQKFNRHFYHSKSFFPQPEPILPDSTAARLRSLRNPEKKMSKSDPDTKSCIYLTDSPDVIAGKVKACVTDSIKELSLCPETRPGVANLMVILSELRGCSPDQACGLYGWNAKAFYIEFFNHVIRVIFYHRFQVVTDYFNSVIDHIL